MYIFFISPFFVLIYTPVEMNKNMIKTRTYKNTSQKLKGENWSRRGETEGSRFDVLKGIRHNFFLDKKCPILSSTLLKSQNHRGVTVLYRVSIGFYKRHKKWSLLKNSLFQGVFQNMNRCSSWWLFVPRVCNGVGIIVTKKLNRVAFNGTNLGQKDLCNWTRQEISERRLRMPLGPKFPILGKSLIHEAR